jgi:hypothetical protein
MSRSRRWLALGRLYAGPEVALGAAGARWIRGAIVAGVRVLGALGTCTLVGLLGIRRTTSTGDAQPATLWLVRPVAPATGSR